MNEPFENLIVYGWAAAAAFLGISKRTLIRWNQIMTVPYRKTPGNRTFFFKSELMKWAELSGEHYREKQTAGERLDKIRRIRRMRAHVR